MPENNNRGIVAAGIAALAIAGVAFWFYKTRAGPTEQTATITGVNIG